ncbi:YggS family pyridoxal phosphate-dependent enzyme [Dubosiella newyorkensis]|uniref:YggS family pyridoxal phosphate-dependent enzyme n=1 Tax=Dubosiella newyorkensis TaxID=1862672 RepID=UPI0023F466E3|nr:YggS family pyridoxal phosphate-dependent enzyme [Dubosiella newyorkensis]
MNTQLIEHLLSLPVQLVAVTKKHTKEEVDALYTLGVRTFGENRVQEFLEKYDPNYSWHIIGHLQTNKVKYIIDKVDMIESVDSLKLASEIEKQAKKIGKVQDILIELKVSDDPNKTGLPLEDLDDLLEKVDQMEHVRLRGLMCIASNTEDTQKIEHEFDTMHSLYHDLQQKRDHIDTLSMGMSHDYPIAIEHGANTIRVGTALFE